MDMLQERGTHHGRLIVQYREAKGWSQARLAEAMHLSLSTINRMEKRPVVKNIKRRELLVSLLGIPAAQLDLDAPPRSVKSPLKPNSDLMALMEDMVSTKWQTYRMGGPLAAASGMEILLHQLTALTTETQGSSWHERALALLSSCHRLQGCIVGDSDYSKGVLSCKTAHSTAQEINDPALMAGALITHGIMLGRQGKLFEALTYAQGALMQIEKADLPSVRGDILTMQAEMFAKTNQTQEYLRSIGLAERTLEVKSDMPDRASYSLTPASLLAAKGNGALILHDYDRAYRLFEKSLGLQTPIFTLSRAKLLAQKAEACYGLGWIDECAAYAEESLFIARSVGSQRITRRVQKLHTTLFISRWKNEPCVARLGALLATH